jgi:endonuclease V-like protein UPF0215 family
MTAHSIRPHVLGIDDGPFDKRADSSVSIVGVMMEGADLVEAVAVSSIPVDGEDAADHLADWVSGLRFASAVHATVLGGMTIAGLGVVDIERLAERLNRPVMTVNRQRPDDERLIDALRAAGLADRIPIVERAPRAWQLDEGLFVSHAGVEREEAARILSAVRRKSQLPEPLRLAHLIAAAVVNGESRGRP